MFGPFEKSAFEIQFSLENDHFVLNEITEWQ